MRVCLCLIMWTLSCRSETIKRNTSLVKYPWFDVEDKECQKVDVMFAEEGSLPMMALVSFPRSGNSWLRQLIEAMTGVFTGSFYNADSLKEDFWGESSWRDGTTIVQKTHHRALITENYENLDLPWRLVHMAYFKEKGILLVRDPYKAIMSYWHLKKSLTYTQSADSRDFQSSAFDAFVNTAVVRWFEVILDWAEHAEKLHVVFFEVCNNIFSF